jgi:thiol-disulfide isomerase/thioredoxin
MKRFYLMLVFIIATSSVTLAQSAGGGQVKLQGQVVCCEECWAEADRKTTPYGTAEDLSKAAQCVANGDPTLLAVADDAGGWMFYELEQGKFKRPGKNWLEYVGKHVEVTGATRSKKDKRVIKVDTLNVLSSPNVAEAEMNVIGTEVELSLKDLYGVEQRLSALRGRVVVLNFWATYCVPCKKEMPDLAAIQDRYAALGVQVVGAAADTAADQPKVMQFIKETRVNFPIWLGASADDMRRFGLGSALPGTVIIGRDGKVVAQIRGVVKQADLKKQIEALLARDASKAKEMIASSNTKPGKVSNVPS